MKSVIVGYSGHSYVILDLINSINKELYGYCELNRKISNPFNLKYLGFEGDGEVIESLKNYEVYLGIGNNSQRGYVFLNLYKYGIPLPSAIHSKANVSSLSEFEFGSVVMAGATINSLSKIGKGVICNSGSIIEHECVIDDFSHIAPGAVLAGNVHIGKYSFIGANSVIKEGVSIGENVIIGAGSVILKDIPSNKKIVGNPSREIKF